MRITKANRMKRIKKAILITMGVLLIIWIVVPFIALPIVINRHINYLGYASKKHPMQDIFTAEEFGLASHEQYLNTTDGKKIWCDEIKAENPKGIIIYLTGIDQPSVTYFYGHSKFMAEHGYSSILVEVRGHGQSDGNKICFGYEETADVQAVVDYIKSQEEYQNLPILLQGVSMGGAISINAFGQIDSVDAVIAMSAFASPQQVVLDLEKEAHVPYLLRCIHKPLVKAVFSLCFGKKKVEEIQPIKLIQNAKERPVFLIACNGDKRGVPSVNTERLKQACPEAEVWVRNSWEHFVVKGCDYREVEQDTEYCERILEFVNSVTND